MRDEARRGELYVFEGPDGVGKTTVAKALTAELASDGRGCEYLSFPGRNPGTLGHLVYEVHHEPEKFSIETVDPTSLQLLHIAAHLDAISRRILPILETGRSVVLDRFWWSTFVYGIVSGVEREQLDAMLDLEHRSWGDTLPTAAFLVSRASPLGGERPTERWQDLRDEYARLAWQQAEHHPVKVVVNDGSIAETLDEVLGSMREVRVGRG